MSIASALQLTSIRGEVFRLPFAHHTKTFERRCVDQFVCPARRWERRSKLLCKSEIEVLPVRRCSPLLESELLPSGKLSDSNDWKAVPDIWKSSAERYGDRVALVDPYHGPPSELTYKQLEEEILYFSEGLRVVGVNPDEKLAVFADNSCRWLIADQAIFSPLVSIWCADTTCRVSV